MSGVDGRLPAGEDLDVVAEFLDSLYEPRPGCCVDCDEELAIRAVAADLSAATS